MANAITTTVKGRNGNTLSASSTETIPVTQIKSVRADNYNIGNALIVLREENKFADTELSVDESVADILADMNAPLA